MISDINKLELDVKWQNLTPGCTIVGSCTAEVFRTEERLSPGHRMCAGCGATIAVRNVLRGLHEEDEAVITCATGCLEVSSFMYPYTAWKDSFIHNAFENAGATCSGVEAAYRALKKKRKSKKALINSSLSVVMAVHTISDSSLYPVQWNEIMIWFTSVTIMALT